MESRNQRRNPYVGPRPFAPGEHDLFFGRDREINDLVNLVFAYGVVLLNAQSGAGKSSLLNAGVIPRLTQEGHRILRTRIRDPYPDSVDAESGSNFFVFKTIVSWNENNPNPEQFAQTTFKQYLDTCERPVDQDGEPLLRVLIFDQFEDLFAFHLRHWEDRRGFFAQLGEALDKDTQLRVVFAIREEYVSRLGAYADLLPDKLRVRYYLEHLRHDAAVKAIINPLKGTERSFTEAAANELATNLSKIRVEPRPGGDDTVPGEFVEPVQLQIICQNLWEQLPPDLTVIQSEQVAVFGDVNEALSGFYERSIKTAVEKTKINEATLRDWFEDNLITVEGTPGLVHRGREKTAGIPNAVVDLLDDLRIIRQEPRSGVPWYELSHDRFVTPIRNANRDWREKRARRRASRILVTSLASVVLVTIVVILLARIQIDSSLTADATALHINLQLQSDWLATRVLGLGGIPTIQLSATPLGDFQGTATAQAQFWKQQVRNINGVDMVLVPAGCFWMGNLAGAKDEQPVFDACIDQPFWIDQKEVTSEEFNKIPEVALRAAAPTWDDLQMPRTAVTWRQALDYCRARNPRGGTLPTEVQWEYAARGRNSLLYPWGNVFIGDPDHVVYAGNSTQPRPFLAGAPGDAADENRVNGRSWVGAYDLSGNVREWTTTLYDQRQYPYPLVDSNEANPTSDVLGERVVRGGAYLSPSPDGRDLTTAKRGHLKPTLLYDDVGFRCVVPDGAET